MGGLRKKGIVGGKLRWNAVLNGASMRGTYYGNTAGTLGTFRFTYTVGALRSASEEKLTSLPSPPPFSLPSAPAFLYNVFNNIVPRARPDNKQDVYTSVASGALAGALFKSTGTYTLLVSSSSSTAQVLTSSPPPSLFFDSRTPTVSDGFCNHGSRSSGLERCARQLLEVRVGHLVLRERGLRSRSSFSVAVDEEEGEAKGGAVFGIESTHSSTILRRGGEGEEGREGNDRGP